MTVDQFGPIYHTEIITMVRCMYADYVVCGGVSGGLVDDFLTVRWDPSIRRGNFGEGRGGIWQCSVGLTTGTFGIQPMLADITRLSQPGYVTRHSWTCSWVQ